MNKEDKKPADAEELVARMDQLRTDLDRNTEKLHAGARKLRDWKGYIRTYPWATLGAAAAAGFLLVPRKKKKRGKLKPDTQELEKLLKSKKLLVAPAKQKAGLASGLTGIALKVVGQVAARQAMQFMQERFHGEKESADEYANVGEPFRTPRREKPR